MAVTAYGYRERYKSHEEDSRESCCEAMREFIAERQLPVP